MKEAPIPEDEAERLQALKRLGVLDTLNEERFDYITREAVEDLNVPISTISIIDKEREWFKSCQGLDKGEDDRSTSFCGHALLAQKLFIVEDTLEDLRFSDNPHVIKEGIRFYAGMALHEAKTNLPVGVFCIKDFKPRKLAPYEVALFLKLGKEAEKELNKFASSS
jgi:GAF domain-containing protein